MLSEFIQEQKKFYSVFISPIWNLEKSDMEIGVGPLRKKQESVRVGTKKKREEWRYECDCSTLSTYFKMLQENLVSYS